MPLTDTLHLATVTRGRSCTVRATGALDAATAHRLLDLGRSAVVADVRSVTLDLAGVALVDVAGWRAVRTFTAELAERGTTVTQAGARAGYERLDAVLVELDTRRHRPERLASSAA